MGIKAPMAMAIPPLLGMGWVCTFRSSGISSTLSLVNIRVKSGMRAMVINKDRRRVERYINFEF